MSTMTRPRVSARPERLRRAVALLVNERVKHLQGSQYHVQSGSGDGYYVDLSEDPTCYCADMENRTVDCKHSIACRLHRADPKLVETIVAWVKATTGEVG